MENLKGTKTEANLAAAFAGESQARNKYTYYASKAKKDGLRADRRPVPGDRQQREGARENLVQAAARRASVPPAANLEDAGGGRELRVDRHVRHLCRRRPGRRASITSPSCLRRSARSKRSTRSGTASCSRTSRRAASLKSDGKVYWQCANCGHIHEGLEAPEVCPVCSHPRAYFQMVAKNY